MDYEQLARELLRELRGRRSQRALSRRLGFDSNVMYRWESGRSWPSVEVFFQLVERVRGSARRAMEQFLGEKLSAEDGRLTESPGVSRLLERLQGDAPISNIARGLGCSRFAVSRWLSGATHVRLPELLAYIELTTLRLLDFLETLVPPKNLPAVRARWEMLEASRRAAYEHPWSHAVLRVLETEEYARLKRHRRGWIAERIGIPLAEEEACLEILRQAGQIELTRGHFKVRETQTVDTRRDREQARRAQRFWLDVATNRHERRVPGTYAYNLCSISEQDFQRLRQMHLTFFDEMRRLIAASEPCERVVLISTQIIALDAPAEEPSQRPGL